MAERSAIALARAARAELPGGAEAPRGRAQARRPKTRADRASPPGNRFRRLSNRKHSELRRLSERACRSGECASSRRSNRGRAAASSRRRSRLSSGPTASAGATGDVFMVVAIGDLHGSTLCARSGAFGSRVAVGRLGMAAATMLEIDDSANDRWRSAAERDSPGRVKFTIPKHEQPCGITGIATTRPSDALHACGADVGSAAARPVFTGRQA